MKTLIDTSVIVQACIDILPNHFAAEKALVSAIDGPDGWFVTAHTLAETFAVLTRLPIKPTISGPQAKQLIEENVLRSATVLALTGPDYHAVIADLAGKNMSGGIIYDALHVHAAKMVNVDRLLTFNVRHFERLWPDHDGVVQSP